MNLDRRILALGIARFADSFGNALLIVVLPLYLTSDLVGGWAFGLSPTVITGIVLAVFGIFDSIVQPLAGRISDRVGRRRVFMLGGLAILVMTNAAFISVSTYFGAFAIRILQGIGVGVTVTASVALINIYSTVDNRGLNFGIFNALRLLGFGIGPAIGGLIISDGPYRVLDWSINRFTMAFDIAVAAAVIGFIIVALLVSEPDIPATNTAPNLSLTVFDGSGGLDPVFSLGIATMFVAAGISLFATVEPILNQRLSQSPTIFGLQFAAFVLAFVLTQPLAGRYSDRFGRKPFIVGGLVLIAPVLFAQGFATTSSGMTALRTVQGIGSAMVFGPALALAGDYATTGSSGVKLSVLTAAFGLGAGLSPVVAGPLADITFALPFIFLAILSVIGAILVCTQVSESVVAKTAIEKEHYDIEESTSS